MKVESLPILLNMVSKIDLNGIIEDIKGLNLKSSNLNEMSDSSKAELGLMIVNRLLPQLGNISEYIIPLVAILKNVSQEEAKELDLLEVVKDLLNNQKLVSFFSSALKNKIGQKS